MASVFVLLEAFNRKEAAALGFFPCATASFCILTTVQTDGFDRCPRFLRRHEVCYMEAYANKSFDVVIVSNTLLQSHSVLVTHLAANSSLQQKHRL